MGNAAVNPYAPCFCGSGKKFKFCCMKRFVGENLFLFGPDTAPDKVDECERLHKKGLALMGERKLEEAIPCFQKAMEMNPSVPNPGNNWSMCLFALGKTEEAVQVQRQTLLNSNKPNPFGLANLAMMLHFLGEDEAALNAVGTAMDQTFQDPSSVAKICMTLAFFDKHQEILDMVDFSEAEADPETHFFAGCAAANLGDRRRAIQELADVICGGILGEVAQRYLERLSAGKPPESIRGNWPYLLPDMFFIAQICSDKTEEQAKTYINSSWYVQFVESELNYETRNKEKYLQYLKFCKHPAASELLWKVAKGSFGSDTLRNHALMLLEERGEIEHNSTQGILTEGKMTSVKVAATGLNPEYEFCPMPDGLEEPYHAIIIKTHDKNVNWAQITEEYRKLFARYPDYFPLEYNLAVALINCGQKEEGKKIVQSIVKRHPDYLFARGALLECYTTEKRWAEGEDLLKTTDFPAETHPDAYLNWALMVSMFFFAQVKFKEAEEWLKMAKKISPENDFVKNLEEKIRTARTLEKMLSKLSGGILGRKKRKKR